MDVEVTTNTSEAPLTAQTIPAGLSVDSLLSQAGLDPTAVRARLSLLKAAYPGGIPEKALARWVDEASGSSRALWMAIGRALEAGG